MNRVPMTITVTIDQRLDQPLLQIVSDEINFVAAGKSTLCSQTPSARTGRFDLAKIIQKQGHKQGVTAIIGQWPGDETDEQIEQAFRDIGS
ncbi:hypothetical protein SAMN05444166_4397 [Singulisphaera sp. GP187]|uniref:hypothetical protein n=1 Tax=Singulisphaera sp. GP187 TaxID=1882752 RepID=UPI00092AED16|nr:hypothetical protein [Singulisphaera sp. GP187]SIO40137.1 hypothetical protein SAMN05444166_4397 [Singulisphaera sp. GP187]